MSEGSDGYGLIESGAIAMQNGDIAWVGEDAELTQADARSSKDVLNCGGRLVTPGLIDCHTHLIYAGNRAREFEMRLQGASYEALARAGGGINATVQATRQASEDELFAEAAPRLKRLAAEGVTTIEVKSGYGLATEHEAKMLRVARRLDQLGVTTLTTFLGAHAVPPEYADRADDYIDLVVKEMLPALAEEGLADAVDAFCENIGFTPKQVERVFRAAAAHGLPIKVHAEQLSNQHGAALAAHHGALSADHLEFLDESDTEVLAEKGTVAVLLPGAFYYLRETQLPPIDALRKNGVPMAIATDSNPGSSPVTSLLLMLNMACTLFHLTPEEALAGVTRNAAKALGMSQRLGTIDVGKRADLVLWNIHEPAELSYRIGDNPLDIVLHGGRVR